MNDINDTEYYEIIWIVSKLIDEPPTYYNNSIISSNDSLHKIFVFKYGILTEIYT